MPTYSYACTECGHRFEAVQAFSDDSLTVCPVCSGKLRKVFSSVGIVFKGSGFYRTDSRAGAVAKGEAKSEKGSESSGSESKGSERKGSESKGSESKGSESKGSGGSTSAKGTPTTPEPSARGTKDKASSGTGSSGSSGPSSPRTPAKGA